MHSESDFAAPFRLGDWLVQPDLNRVTGPTGEVRLEPRVMLVLVRLAAVPGEVVSQNVGPNFESGQSGIGLRFLEMKPEVARKVEALYESKLKEAGRARQLSGS